MGLYKELHRQMEEEAETEAMDYREVPTPIDWKNLLHLAWWSLCSGFVIFMFILISSALFGCATSEEQENCEAERGELKLKLFRCEQDLMLKGTKNGLR